MDIKKTSAHDQVLNNLIQNYEREFSSITKKKPTKDGLYILDVDLSETDNYLLFVLNEAVGFCVKGIFNNRHDVVEFYIRPENRGNQIGRNFALEIFKMYKGNWQVRQIEGADKAMTFWRKTISLFTDENYEESIIEDAYWGNVTRQSFKSL